MENSDELTDTIVISNIILDSYSEVHNFLQKTFPEQFAAFQQIYGIMISNTKCLIVLGNVSALEGLFRLPNDEPRMLVYKERYKRCNNAGAWLLFNIQSGGRSDVADKESSVISHIRFEF